jgi:outer membrane protein
MKKISAVLNIVLLVAVIFLFYKVYATPGGGKPSSEKEISANLNAQEFDGVKIAYINTDSLVEKYDYHKELRSKLEAKAKTLEADIAQKLEVFEESVRLLQEKAGTMNEAQLQQNQADLGQTQQRLYSYRDQKAAELAQEEQELNLLIRDDMKKVMDEFKEKYGLDYILSFDPNSIVLTANDQYDITDIVVTRLNEKYGQERSEENTVSE